MEKIQQKPKRESGLELYRVLVMLLIVAHHYVVNSGLISLIDAAPGTGSSFFLLLFGAWGKTGINCFVLITGYFMCRSSITLGKYAKLLLEIVFYRIVIWLIFFLTGYETFSVMTLIRTILPVTSVQQNFTGCFLVFYLFIPFLNILVKHMNRRQHLCLVTLCLGVYTLLGTVPTVEISLNYVTWFIVLYFVASYLRLYPQPLFENRKLWGWISLGMIALSSASVVVCHYMGKTLGRSYYFLSDSNRILAVATAISTFLYFKNLKLGYKPFINALGATTFGVLLIHANCDAMRRWLWGDLLHNTEMFASPWLPLHAILSVLAVFAICSVIDMLRIVLLERPLFRHWDSWKAYWCSRFGSKLSGMTEREGQKKE